MGAAVPWEGACLWEHLPWEWGWVSARDGQSLAPLRHMTTDDVTQVSNPKIKFENEKKNNNNQICLSTMA